MQTHPRFTPYRKRAVHFTCKMFTVCSSFIKSDQEVARSTSEMRKLLWFCTSVRTSTFLWWIAYIFDIRFCFAIFLNCKILMHLCLYAADHFAKSKIGIYKGNAYWKNICAASVSAKNSININPIVSSYARHDFSSIYFIISLYVRHNRTDKFHYQKKDSTIFLPINYYNVLLISL